MMCDRVGLVFQVHILNSKIEGSFLGTLQMLPHFLGGALPVLGETK